MEILTQQELCDIQDRESKDRRLSSIATGTVFRGQIGKNIPHVWMKTKDHKVLCIAEGGNAMTIGQHGYSIQDTVIHNYEQLDVVLVLQ